MGYLGVCVVDRVGVRGGGKSRGLHNTKAAKVRRGGQVRSLVDRNECKWTWTFAVMDEAVGISWKKLTT